jgi:pyruvate,water dikinase
MVFCDKAGVGFSINPVNGSLDELVIDANFGLGESVVSGEGEIDHWVLDKSALKVKEARIAAKSRMVVAGGTGTSEQAVPKAQSAQPCLAEAELAELAKLLLKVEASYRFPQDIEWGFAKGRLHLLQARPITTIPPRWTRDESAERFPNVLTPLTWDFVEGGFHRSLNFSFKLMGYPPFQGKWFGMHGHYIYGNQNAVELYGRRVPLELKSLDEMRAAVPMLREHFRWVQELPVMWMRDLDYYLLKLGEFMAEPLDQKDVHGVWDFVLKVNEHGADYFLPNIAISLTQGTLHRALHGLLRVAAGAEAARLFDGLLAFCETKTGAINRELFELARTARSAPALEKLILNQDSRKLAADGDLAAFPEFAARFQRFLRDHGHREVDFDAYQPTWVEAPWSVLDNVKLILQTPMDQSPAQKERELRLRQQQCEQELFTRLPEDLHFFFSELLRLTRAYTSLDDLEHYQTTRLTLPLRKGLRELGRRLLQKGVVTEPMDVFFAHLKDIDDAVEKDKPECWKELGASIAQSKAAYLKDKARTPDWVLGQAPSATASGDHLDGIAGSSGAAEGPVFLVLTPDDFARFPKGAVLVARTTNPTWTPLFYSAVAVVTESGGPLSHGAVTAREMQIPAVMSVKGSLARLKNGQRVRVDGDSGRVQLLG